MANLDHGVSIRFHTPKSQRVLNHLHRKLDQLENVKGRRYVVMIQQKKLNKIVEDG